MEYCIYKQEEINRRVILPLKIRHGLIINIPVPIDIRWIWNIRSMMRVRLVIQIITRLILACNFSVRNPYNSVAYIIREVNRGPTVRYTHIIRVHLLMRIIYIHIIRGVIKKSYLKIRTWNSRVVLLVILIAISFLRYVLPWGQISLWRATVITSLLTVMKRRERLLIYVWRGYRVSVLTLRRLYCLHFLLPILILILIRIHLFLLHGTRSSGKIRGRTKILYTKFYPLYIWKDAITIIGHISILALCLTINPSGSTETDNWVVANNMVTPRHIKPEWYFLLSYAVLRSVPNKGVRVRRLLISIIIIIVLALKRIGNVKNGYRYTRVRKLRYWIIVRVMVVLTALRRMVIMPEYLNISLYFTCIYFLIMICI